MFKLSNICEQTITKTHTRDLTIKPAVTCSDNATLPRPSFPTVQSGPIEAAFMVKSFFPSFQWCIYNVNIPSGC